MKNHPVSILLKHRGIRKLHCLFMKITYIMVQFVVLWGMAHDNNTCSDAFCPTCCLLPLSRVKQSSCPTVTYLREPLLFIFCSDTSIFATQLQNVRPPPPFLEKLLSGEISEVWRGGSPWAVTASFNCKTKKAWRQLTTYVLLSFAWVSLT